MFYSLQYLGWRGFLDFLNLTFRLGLGTYQVTFSRGNFSWTAHKCKLNQDGPSFPPPDSDDHLPPVPRDRPQGGGGGGSSDGDAQKVRRLVEAMHMVVMSRERWWWKVGGDGFSSKFEKVDGGK